MERQPESESNPPDDLTKVSLQDLIDFAVGEASDEVSERVKKALNDPSHPLSYLKERGAADERTDDGSDA